MRLRKRIVQLHRYAGLALGLCLSLTGVTGSLLVFDHALDERLTPAIRVNQEVPSTSVDAVLSAARAAAPEGSQLVRLDVARQPGSPHNVRLRGPDKVQSLIEVSVDPGTADILAIREWGHYPMSWLYRLHYTLLAGDSGKTVVGFFGFVLLFFCVSGFYLWWPRRGRWRKSLSVEHRRGALRLFWDLHRVVGVMVLPILSLCALTGVAMVFAKPTSMLVGALLPLRDVPRYSVQPAGDPLPLDELSQRAVDHWPGSTLKRIYLPRTPEDSVRITLRHPAEQWTNHGASSLWFDPYTGAVLGEWAAPHNPAGNRVLAWVFPLHNADALGIGARYLWILAGLTPALLFSSGAWLWWNKQRRN